MVLTAALAILLAVLPASAAQASTAELLEKGIFTEETVGDLKTAIEIYSQVVDEVAGERPHAARALYRMGLCYAKVGDAEKSKSTFERLIADYSDQADLVSLARKELVEEGPTFDLLPVPWQDGEEAHMVFKFPNGRPLGKVISAVEKDQIDGREVWRMQVRRLFGDASRGVTNVVVDAEDLSPIRTDVWHSQLGAASTSFSDGSATITRPQHDEPQVSDVVNPIFENDSVGFFFRRLPFDIGYTGNARLFVSFTGQQLDLGLTVPQIDTITTSLGDIPSYRVDLSINQKAWIAVDGPRYGTKAEMGGIVGTLTEVLTRRRSDPVSYSNTFAEYHLPPDWALFDRGEKGEIVSQVELQDPRAAAFGMIRIKSSKVSEEELDIAARIQAAIKDNQETLGTYEVTGLETEESGSTDTGRYIGHFELSGKKMVHYRSFLLTEDAWVKILFLVPEDQLEDLRESMDSIMNRFRLL
jgi:hypothetical protein